MAGLTDDSIDRFLASESNQYKYPTLCEIEASLSKNDEKRGILENREMVNWWTFFSFQGKEFVLFC